MNEKILDLIDDIDTRRELGLMPRRIDMRKYRALEKYRDGIVYNTKTSTLYNFRPDGYHEIRRGVSFDVFSDGLWVFNLYGSPYAYEVIGDDGTILMDPCATQSWATEYRVILK